MTKLQDYRKNHPTVDRNSNLLVCEMPTDAKDNAVPLEGSTLNFVLTVYSKITCIFHIIKSFILIPI